MSFYSDLATTVNELLTEFGQSVTVTNLGMAVEDPATGVVSQETSSFTTIGVLLDFDSRSFGDGSVPNQATSKTDKRLLISADQLINAGDTVIVDGSSYMVNVVKTTEPAGVRVVYDLWIQK